jgi:5-formyltetrahydrofolate cyclo-ligase
MTHYLLTDNTIIKKNNWNIPEPENGLQVNESKLEVIFIPLLAFDVQGNRIGYGKGFYDVFLKKCPGAIKVGLSFFHAEEELFNDINSKYIALDYCITPNKIYKFS